MLSSWNIIPASIKLSTLLESEMNIQNWVDGNNHLLKQSMLEEGISLHKNKKQARTVMKVQKVWELTGKSEVA